MIDTTRMVLKSEVLRSRGKNNTFHDIDDAAHLLIKGAGEIEQLRKLLKDVTFALKSRLTEKELNAQERKPYEHPLSVFDRAYDYLTTPENEQHS